jgi:hypothetical protein
MGPETYHNVTDIFGTGPKTPATRASLNSECLRLPNYTFRILDGNAF